MKNHAIYLQTQSFMSTFITIQRYYRGYKERQEYKLYLRFKKLKVKELNACIFTYKESLEAIFHAQCFKSYMLLTNNYY